MLDPATYQPVEQLDMKRNADHFMGWAHNAKARSRSCAAATSRRRRRASTRCIKGDIDATDSYLPTDQVERVLKSKNVRRDRRTSPCA